MLPDSMNIGVIAENIRKLNTEMKKNALPSVNSEDAGKVLTVSEEGKWVANDSSSPSSVMLDYTTIPTKTGYKFMGRDVYRVAIPWGESGEGTLSNTTEFPGVPEDYEIPVNSGIKFENSDGVYFAPCRVRKVETSTPYFSVNVYGYNYSNVTKSTCYLMLDFLKTVQSESKTKKKTSKKGE